MHTHKLAKRVQEGQPRFSEPSLRPRTKQEKVLRGVFLDFLPHQRRQGPSISSNCSEVFQTAVFPLTGKQGRKQAPSPASRSLSQEGGIQAGAAWAEQYTPFALSSVHCSSVTQSCMTLCDPMNRSTPGLPVHHHLPGSLRLMSIESVMPSSHLILCRPLLLLPHSLPASKSFPMSQLFA